MTVTLRANDRRTSDTHTKVVSVNSREELNGQLDVFATEIPFVSWVADHTATTVEDDATLGKWMNEEIHDSP